MIGVETSADTLSCNLNEGEQASEERYELIAQIAQGFSEYKESSSLELGKIWDSNDINFDFEGYLFSID